MAVVVIEAVVAAADDKEIHVGKYFMSIKIKGNIKTIYIFVLVCIEHNIQEKIQGQYTLGRCYHADYVNGMEHTPQRITL